MISQAAVAAVVLAGGRSARFNEAHHREHSAVAKAKHLLAGKTLLQRVVDRLRPQVAELIINTNDAPDWYRHFGLPVVADEDSGYRGPLAGLAAAMDFLQQQHSPCEALLVVPCDGPFVPENLCSVLLHALNREESDCACIRYEGVLQPTFSLWRCSAQSRINQEFGEKGMGGFKSLFARLKTTVVDWPESEVNPFFNINTPDELELAEKLIHRHPLAGGPL